METLDNSPRHSDAAAIRNNEHLSVTPGPIESAEDSHIEGSASNNPLHKTLEV